jgi:hypothetical protein
MCILMLGANAAVNDREGSLRRIFKSTNLVDVFELHTGRKSEILTYTRGTKRIDFILSSCNLLPYVKKVGYTAFYDVSESDHRGTFIELSNDILDHKIELKQPKKREICSKSKKCNIYEYKQDIHKEFIKQNIYKDGDILYKLTMQPHYHEQYLTKKLNNIDHKVTKIVLRAEKKNRTRKSNNKWSIALHQQSLLCRYWSIIKRGMKKRKGNTKTNDENIQATVAAKPTKLRRDHWRCIGLQTKPNRSKRTKAKSGYKARTN